MKALLFATTICVPLLACLMRAQTVVLPKLCRPCLFYGGDLSPDDINAEAFPNGASLPNSDQTYIAVRIPAHHTVQVEGLLVQTVIERGNGLDPKQAAFEIATDVVTGIGGTVVAGGVLPAAVQPTGRQFDGFPEYTIAVKLDPSVQLSGGKYPGTVYWFNLTPECLNPHDPYCYSVSYLESNSSATVNSFNLRLEQSGENDFVWPPQKYVFEPCDQSGYGGNQCLLSFGIMGTVVQ